MAAASDIQGIATILIDHLPASEQTGFVIVVPHHLGRVGHNGVLQVHAAPALGKIGAAHDLLYRSDGYVVDGPAILDYACIGLQAETNPDRGTAGIAGQADLGRRPVRLSSGKRGNFVPVGPPICGNLDVPEVPAVLDLVAVPEDKPRFFQCREIEGHVQSKGHIHIVRIVATGTIGPTVRSAVGIRRNQCPGALRNPLASISLQIISEDGLTTASPILPRRHVVGAVDEGRLDERTAGVEHTLHAIVPIADQRCSTGRQWCGHAGTTHVDVMAVVDAPSCASRSVMGARREHVRAGSQDVGLDAAIVGGPPTAEGDGPARII